MEYLFVYALDCAFSMFCVTQGVHRNGPSVYISIYDVVEYCVIEYVAPDLFNLLDKIFE